MTYQELIDRMDPTVYQSLRQAVELGKWPDGRVLSAEQRELCMEAVLHYESKNVPEEERVGYIDRGKKTEGETCGSSDDAAPIRILS
ncbi:YeaC family protein [Marinobacter xestospongiae]|uniref:DUF1315 family protein n=1 Tax=Marinobacter xestospongiae TaxID=994319 RepID=A0ABU3VSF8_9GAMM|nr:DUF1315 family protein [Marinobacter xestospongiae]MDV2077131.1 DUF1315 family protein [Marinobacter xestospongiae]